MSINYDERVTEAVKRLCQDMSQQKLGEVLGLSQSCISQRFLGRTRWTLADLERLHRKLGLVVELPAIAWSQSDE